MKRLLIGYLFIFILGFAQELLAMPVENLPEDSGLLKSANEVDNPFADTGNAYKIQNQKLEQNKNQNQIHNDSSSINHIPLSQSSKLQNNKDAESTLLSIDYVKQDADSYLFNQQASNGKKNGSQTGSLLLTPEMKKSLKQVWAETADFREAVDISAKRSDANDFVMQDSMGKLPLMGEEAQEKAVQQPYQGHKKKNPDKLLVKELFDGIYDLIKNFLLIFVSVLLIAKLISFYVKKVTGSKHRRKKKISTRRKRKRRHTYA